MSKSAAIRLLLADDHYVVRMGLAAICEQEDDLRIVAQAVDGAEAVELFRQHRPDVVLMDLFMPRLSGVEALRAIRKDSPSARVIMLTTYDADEDIYRALEAGACGYVLKNMPGEELFRAIRQAHVGRKYLPTVVASRLAERLEQPALTAREVEVMRLVVAGESNKEIAEAMKVTEHTAKMHLKNIFAKLGARDRTEAAMLVLRRGIVLLT